MKVTTDLTLKDWVWLNIFVALKLKMNQYLILFGMLFLIFFGVWKSGVPVTFREWFTIILIAISPVLFGLLVMVIGAILWAYFSTLNSKGLLCQHHFEINVAGLREQTRVNDSIHMWEGIDEIIDNKFYLLFRISGSLYHILPKRCFSSEQQFNQFFQTAQNFWRQAQAKK